jgi:hypothetical protein
MKSKMLTALRAMLDGIPLEHGGYVFHILDREDGKGKALCVEVEKLDLGTKQKTTEYMGYDITFNDMLVLLEGLDEDEVFLMASNAALTDINRGGGPTRIGHPTRRGA